MNKKKKTGIPGMDKVLDGGIPDHAAVLIQAPPGSGKSTFCHQFLKQGMGEGEPVIYIATGEPIEHVISTFEDMGVKPNKKSFFIDCYSWRVSGAKPPKQSNVVKLDSLTELNELNRVIKAAIKKTGMDKTGGRIVIDSLSDLLLYVEPSSVFRFLQLFVGVIKGASTTAIIVLEEGLHEPRHVSTVNYICDGTIHMKTEDETRSIRVVRMLDTIHPLNWLPFSIGRRGVEINVEEFFR